MLGIRGRNRRNTRPKENARKQETGQVQEEHNKKISNLIEQEVKKRESNKCLELTRTGFAAHMAKYIGQTVTIFTSSGGASGIGFTGILLSVNNIYVRLITRIGPPPACSLDNCCSFSADMGYISKFDFNTFENRFGSGIIGTLGSITYIKVDRIVSFVHNAV